MSINADWHARHPMPKRATLEQRATWHVDHARHCACRPIPRTVQAAIGTRADGGRTPPAK